MFISRVVRASSISGVSRHIRNFSVAATVSDTAEHEPEYPPILDLSFRAVRTRKKEEHYALVKRQKTVEEKLIAVNMPRYYGWISIQMKENEVPYDSLEHAQYVTRTHIFPQTGLPSSFYDNVISTEALDSIVENVRSQVEEVLVLEYSRRK